MGAAISKSKSGQRHGVNILVALIALTFGFFALVVSIAFTVQIYTCAMFLTTAFTPDDGLAAILVIVILSVFLPFSIAFFIECVNDAHKKGISKQVSWFIYAAILLCLYLQNSF